MKGKKLFALLLLISILPLSGCWDKVEIEQRAIINSMFIEKGKGEQGLELSEDINKGKLKVTFGILIPSTQGEGKDMGYSRVIYGDDMTQVLSRLGEETSRVPFYGQTRMLILSRDFLKEKDCFKRLLDFIDRNSSINTQMRVIVTNNDVKDITGIEARLESSTTEHIIGILKNSERFSNTVSISLEKLIDDLKESDGSGVLPVLEALPDNQTFRIDELGLIKDYTYMTEIDPKMVKQYKIITDNFSGGIQQVEFEGENLSAYIYGCKSKKKFKPSNGTLGFKVIVEAEGNVEQFCFDKNMMDKDTIKKAETALENQMKKELEEATEYFQNEIGHDYLGFEEYLKKYKPKEYKKYKSNWEEQFKNAEIEYEVTFHIRRRGTTK